MKPHPPVDNELCRPGESDDLLLFRHNMIAGVRGFFVQRGFLEVETPALIPSADPSPHLDSFVTHYRDLEGRQCPLYLRTSPEFAMKRLVAAGYPKLFQVCKFFRNGEITTMHNPEFTGLEWYHTHTDYHTLMELTEGMVRALWPHPTLTYQGQTVDMASPWEQLTVHGAIERYANVTLPNDIQRSDLADACRNLGLSANPDDQWDDLFFKIFLTYVEPHLGRERPLFLKDYPVRMAALSRTKPDNPHVAERVELYIAGVELANGYSELIDPDEQRRRWEEEVKLRKINENPFAGNLDEGLLNALAWGMPPTAGIALGLDRLFMLFRDASTLQEVLPFPLQHPNHRTLPASEG